MNQRKQSLILSIILVAAFLLGACAPAQSAVEVAPTEVIVETVARVASVEPTVAQDSTPGVELNADYENAVSIEQQLIFGTLKLTGSDLAITKEQAAKLLPLWNNFKTLSMSMVPGQDGSNSQTQSDDTAALVEQIEAAMTSEQIQTIADMQITTDIVQTITQEQNISMGGANGSGGGGQPPQGTPPSGVPDGNGGAGSSPSKPGGNGGQPPSGDGHTSRGGMLPPELLDAVIQLMEKTSGTQASSSVISATTNNGNAGGSSTYILSGAYTLDGGSETSSGQTYTASNTDQSAIFVTNGGNLTLTDATVTTSGDTSSADNSSFHGLNAGVLAANGGSITLSNSSISTTGTGANGAFATESGSSVTLNNIVIDAKEDGAHGVMATNGGVITLNNVDITTAGPHSGAISTDRGSGTITASGGTVVTTGADSPAIYSTGNITISNGTLSVTGAEAAVIEGSNSIALNNSALTSSFADKWGVMIYQSFSGDAEGSQGNFTMNGGSLSYTSATGPLFYVNNATGIINLNGVTISAGSGVLLNAAANDRWGTSGANGGNIILNADNQILNGNMTADSISLITVTMKNGSMLTGTINSENTAQSVNLTLDASSIWNVTDDSNLTCVSTANLSNINGNGHTVYYDANACSDLGGKTYSLKGGGSLKPSN